MPESAPIIDLTRPCIKCGYDLKGLAHSGQCPECATPVERSLRGDFLEYSDEAYLRSLLRGVTLIMTGIVLAILNMILGVAFAALLGPGAILVSGALGLVASAISAYGYYLYSDPDPGQLSTNRGEGPRRVVRITLVISVIAAAVQFVLQLMGAGTIGAGIATGAGAMWLTIGAAAAGGLAWVIQFFAVMMYTKWLAPRIPSERIFKRAKLLMWLGPVLCVFFFCAIAPLIAMVLYYNMFSWMRKDLLALIAKAEPPSVAASAY